MPDNTITNWKQVRRSRQTSPMICGQYDQNHGLNCNQSAIMVPKSNPLSSIGKYSYRHMAGEPCDLCKERLPTENCGLCFDCHFVHCLEGIGV
jgi:hypothetical protein